MEVFIYIGIAIVSIFLILAITVHFYKDAYKSVELLYTYEEIGPMPVAFYDESKNQIWYNPKKDEITLNRMKPKPLNIRGMKKVDLYYIGEL